MKIGLDFDGVVADVGKLKSSWARELFGLDVDFNNPDLDKKELISKKRQSELLDFVINDVASFAHLRPVRGAVTGVKKLVKKHNVEIITGREGAALEAAKTWLKKHKLDIKITSVGAGNSKRSFVKGLDIFVDDSLINLAEMVKVVPNRFLFSWGYNEEYKEGDTAIRARSWEDLYSRIGKIKKK